MHSYWTRRACYAAFAITFVGFASKVLAEYCEYATSTTPSTRCPDVFVEHGLTLTCDSDQQVLALEYVNYGRESKTKVCGSQTFNASYCFSSKGSAPTKCDNQTSCVITQTDVGDECDDPKYIYVSYNCISRVSFRVVAYSTNPSTCPMASFVYDWYTPLYRVVHRSLSSCYAPLFTEVTTARVTLERYLESDRPMEIRVFLSGAAFCSSLALTLMVEVQCEDEPVILHECSLQGEGEESGHRYCLYHCECAGPCNRVHLQFQSLKAIGIDNTAWEYCGVQFCAP